MERYPKRLIEVDLPIKRISAHSRREKSIRYGHISTLHVWWARRPLAACRAVICAALWPDPADENCPEVFRKTACKIMREWTSHDKQKLLSSESRPRFEKARQNPVYFNNYIELRNALLDFIADFADWDNSIVSEYLDTSRELTQAAHEALGGAPGTKPLVVDSFAGGGSIPLEALRIGADAFASDLNPVSILLNKVVLEYIPQYGHRLADEVRKWGEWINSEAQKKLEVFFPQDTDGTKPIAYLWARTVRCEGPKCGIEVPLIRSLWLAKTGARSVALKLVPKPNLKMIDIEIITGVKASDVAEGTSRRGSATCPLCGYTTPATSIRRQLGLRNGGARDARLLAVRQDDPKTGTRCWRLCNEKDYKAVENAAGELARLESQHHEKVSLIPDEVLPVMSGVFNAPLYGHSTWGSLFSDRQALVLTTIASLVREVGDMASRMSRDSEFGAVVQTCLALALDRLADFNSSLCVLNSTGGRGVVHTFGRQALPMVWDFMETNPFNEVGANWMGAIKAFTDTIQRENTNVTVGHAEICSATDHPLPDDSAAALITDPPYYNAVPYADLSDFFYVWLKRSLGTIHEQFFSENLSPKSDEACELAGWDPVRYSHKNAEWFEGRIRKALQEGRRVLAPGGIAVVVFAHKSTSGWEALLQGLVDSGLMLTGSWPIDTERPGRLRAQESAALASSVHLVCRPRENPDGSIRMDDIGDWRDVLLELPHRIHEWMPRLAEEGVVGADAIFACLGPALEIFSRYTRVEKISGETVTLKEYLEQVWAAVAREALSMIFTGADATGFEEDARLTAMWLWTLKTEDTNGTEEEEDEEGGGKKASKGGFALEYDAARKIAQGLGAHLENLDHLVAIQGETAVLLPVAARTRYLFGKDAAEAPRSRPKKKDRQMKFDFSDELKQIEEESGGWAGDLKNRAGRTVLDQLHQGMIFFAAGRSEALRRFLVEEGIGRNPLFWRLAQALSALYPTGTDEKRWVDGVLARKKGLGF